MTDDQMDLKSQALASQLLSTIEDTDPPRGVVLKALDYCRNQLENRTAVETRLEAQREQIRKAVTNWKIEPLLKLQ